MRVGGTVRNTFKGGGTGKRGGETKIFKKEGGSPARGGHLKKGVAGTPLRIML